MDSSTILGQSLKTRITLTTLLIFLASLWSLSYFASEMLRRDMERFLGEQQFSTVSVIAEQINDVLDDRLRTLENAAQRVTPSMLRSKADLQAFLENRPAFGVLFNGGFMVLNLEGMVVADVPLATGRIGVNLMDRDSVATALKEGRTAISEPAMGKILAAPIFHMTVPIRDAQGRVIAAMSGVTNLGLPNFLDKISNSRYGRTGGYLLVAPRHRLVVTSTDKSRIMEKSPAPGLIPAIDRFMQGHEGSAEYVNPMGIEMLSSAKNIPLAGWYLVANLPVAEAFAPIRVMQKRMWLATLFLTLFAGGLTWWMLKRQLSPLLRATKSLADMADATQTLQELPVSGKDEIGQLIGGFNILLKSLRQQERTLKESESLQRTLLQSILAGVIIVNPKTRVIESANNAAAAMFGAAPEAIVGHRCHAFLCPAAECSCPILDLGKSVDNMEKEMLCADGGRRTVLKSVTRIQIQGQEKLLECFVDINERKQAEEQITKSVSLLNATLQSTNDAILVVNLTSVWLLYNQRFIDLWRIPDELIAAKDDRAALDYVLNQLEDADGFLSKVNALYGTPEIQSFDILYFKDGRIVERYSIPQRIDGKVVGRVWSFRDITERKLRELALIESERRFHDIVSASADWIWEVNTDARYTYVSEGVTALLGYQPEEILGKLPFDFMPPEEAARVGAIFATIMEQRAPFRDLDNINCHRDGSWRHVQTNGVPILDASGKLLGYRGLDRDITERKRAEEKINQLAFFDHLTNLPNRTLLQDRLKQAMAGSQRSGRYGALLLIDLDYFKTLNDTLGHDMGDLLLKVVARRLTECVREEDTVARLGGDEFVVMLVSLSESQNEAASLVELIGSKINTVLNQTYELNEVSYRITPSIGASVFMGQQTDIDALLKQADLAMYKAKDAGRNTLRFFDPDMARDVSERASLNNDLREAVQKKQFVLHYQVQVNGNQVTGAEALLRWQHPKRGLVFPGEFISVIEETGHILPVGQWVLESTCEQLAAWAAQPEMSHLTVAVNISARQLNHENFVDQVLLALDRSGANPRRLKLELTESVLVNNIEDIIVKMAVLKAKGVGFSLDDFGTGYSSLAYLKRLPLDQLKIDQSFVRDILTDPNDAAIAKMIVILAGSLGLAVIAEGVETEVQKDSLEQQGCNAFQGYFFSRPLPLDEFESFVKRAQCEVNDCFV